MIYYFPRLDRISYIEVTSEPFFFLRIHIQFCQSWVSFLRPIQMAFEKITMSYATCTILQCDYGAFLLHYMPARNLKKKKTLEATKMGMRIWKFQWWNWSKGPLICRNGEWFWFRSSVFQNQKGQGNCHQSEIIDRIQSEPKHNYWGARKNVQSVIFVPHCIFMHGNCQNDISNSPSPNYNYLMCRILGT